LKEVLLRKNEGGGVRPEDIGIVTLSHGHWDHSGDPSPYTSASFFVGKGTHVPVALPTQESLDTEGKGRKMNILDFQNMTPGETIDTGKTVGKALGPVGSFERSFDVFGDGSFVLCDAPGHCHGHMIALVRVKAPEGEGDSDWLVLAGDTCHHGTLLSSAAISKNPNLQPSQFRKPGDPEDEPPKRSMMDDFPLAIETISRARMFEDQDNVAVILAHDRPWWDRYKLEMERIKNEGSDKVILLNV